MGQESNREEPWVNTVEATLQKEGKYKRVSVWGGGKLKGGVCGGRVGRVGVEGRVGWRGGWGEGESVCEGMLGGCGSFISLPAVVLCSSGGDTSAGVHQA